MFKLSFKTDNAAFADDDLAYESAMVLRAVANKIEAGELSGAIMDSNGNKVGEFSFD